MVNDPFRLFTENAMYPPSMLSNSHLRSSPPLLMTAVASASSAASGTMATARRATIRTAILVAFMDMHLR